jgi:hypothetical protein
MSPSTIWEEWPEACRVGIGQAEQKYREKANATLRHRAKSHDLEGR